MKEKIEMDRFRITIAFGILSFQLALMIFLFTHSEATGITVIFSGFFRFIVSYSIFILFLFILCTAAFYKHDRKGILDFLKVSEERKDILFSEAIEWSFVAATSVGIGYMLDTIGKLINIRKCGEEFWSLSICYAGLIASLIFVFLICRKFFKTIQSD